MRTIFSILLLFITHFIFAQCNGYKYIPFPESGGKWHVHEDERLYDGTSNSFDGDYYQNGDTVINSIKYSIISRSGIDLSFGITIYEVVGFMRQDTSFRKVYFKPINSSEYTLYDFSNKSLKSGFVENNLSYYSTDMGGVVMNNGVHRYLRLAPTSFIINAFAAVDSNKIAIEGIGSENGLINNLFGEDEISSLGSWRYKYSKLISFSINDTIIYSSQHNFPFTYSNLIPSKILYLKNCIHQSYMFYGDTIYNEGSYYHIQKSNCDTLIVLNLEHLRKVISDSSTFFKPYYFNGKYLKSEGIYYDTIQSMSGCDSLAELHLTKYFLNSSLVNSFLCQGDTFFYKNKIITQIPSAIIDTLQNRFGNDSIILRIGIWSPVKKITTIIAQPKTCSCQFMGTTITVSGIYYFTTNKNGGCDSVTKLDVRFKNHPGSTQNVTLNNCSGGYNFNGVLLTKSGTYFDTLKNIYGCDSLVTLNLSFHKKIVNKNFQICKGDTLFIGLKHFTTQGAYYDTLSDYLGCDSILKINLTYYSVKHSYQYYNLNPCDSLIFFGKTIRYKYIDYSNQSFVWINDTINSTSGCIKDSIIHAKISFNKIEKFVSKTIPLGTFYNFYGIHYYQSGKYVKVLKSACGADSIVSLILDVRADYHYLIDTSVFRCKLPYHFYGSLLSQAGTFYDTLVSQIGMDSIIIIKLNVFDTIETWIDTSSFCQDSILIGNIYYNQSGWNFKQTLSSYKGCDSTIHIDIHNIIPPLKISLGNDQVMHGSPITININTSSSVDTFFCSNGDTIFYPNKSITFNSVGTYVVKAKSYFGCETYDTITISYPLNSMNINRQSEIKISPNPCTDELKISNLEFRTRKLEVINVVGQIVLNQQVNNSTTQSINVSSLTQGIYLLKCTDENGMVHQAKFVKQ